MLIHKIYNHFTGEMEDFTTCFVSMRKSLSERIANLNNIDDRIHILFFEFKNTEESISKYNTIIEEYSDETKDCANRIELLELYKSVKAKYNEYIHTLIEELKLYENISTDFDSIYYKYFPEDLQSNKQTEPVKTNIGYIESNGKFSWMLKLQALVNVIFYLRNQKLIKSYDDATLKKIIIERFLYRGEPIKIDSLNSNFVRAHKIFDKSKSNQNENIFKPEIRLNFEVIKEIILEKFEKN